MECPLCQEPIERGQPFIQSFTMEPHHIQGNQSVMDGKPLHYADIRTDHGGVHVKCLVAVQAGMQEIRSEHSSLEESLVAQGSLTTWGC